MMFDLGTARTFLLTHLLNQFCTRMRESHPWLTKWIRYGAGLVLILIGMRRLWLI
jgi:threonine/homoserine/homoserine lactone efflux protein